MTENDEQKETMPFRDHLMFVRYFCFNNIQMLNYFLFFPPDFKNTAVKDVRGQQEIYLVVSI